jgi:hypothetical protein
VLVATVTAGGTIEHAFTPDHIGKNGKADRPDEDKAKNHGSDPGWLAPIIQPAFRTARPAGNAVMGALGRCVVHNALSVGWFQGMFTRFTLPRLPLVDGISSGYVKEVYIYFVCNAKILTNTLKLNKTMISKNGMKYVLCCNVLA